MNQLQLQPISYDNAGNAIMFRDIQTSYLYANHQGQLIQVDQYGRPIQQQQQVPLQHQQPQQQMMVQNFQQPQNQQQPQSQFNIQAFNQSTTGSIVPSAFGKTYKDKPKSKQASDNVVRAVSKPSVKKLNDYTPVIGSEHVPFTFPGYKVVVFVNENTKTYKFEIVKD